MAHLNKHDVASICRAVAERSRGGRFRIQCPACGSTLVVEPTVRGSVWLVECTNTGFRDCDFRQHVLVEGGLARFVDDPVETVDACRRRLGDEDANEVDDD